MRHGVGTKKLGRTSEHRQAMFRNLLIGLFKARRITTTLSKAKEVRPLAEKIVTWGKKDSLHARRMVYRYMQDHSLVQLVFKDVAPKFLDRAGGYTRILKLGLRRGDGAEEAILEFVDFKYKAKEKKDAKKKAAKK
jgi:large subunit ribosomal protein L17